MHNGWSTYYRLATYLIELVDSLPAMRLFDILRAADVVEEYHGENCAVTFYGEEAFARYAKIAAFLPVSYTHLDVYKRQEKRLPG